MKKLRKRTKLVTVARDVRNSGRDYMIEEDKARALFNAGRLTWVGRFYLDEGGKTYNELMKEK